MRADVTECGGAEHGVRNGVTDGIGIRMARQALVEWNGNATEDEWSASGEYVRVVAYSDAHSFMGIRGIFGDLGDWSLTKPRRSRKDSSSIRGFSVRPK